MLQLYPSGPEQAELITSAALRVGFSGGLVVDFPNSTRAKKYFLVLMAGPSDGALHRAEAVASLGLADGRPLGGFLAPPLPSARPATPAARPP